MLKECFIYLKDFSILDLVLHFCIINGQKNFPVEKQKLLKMKYGHLYQMYVPEEQLLYICSDSNSHIGTGQELLQYIS